MGKLARVSELVLGFAVAVCLFLSVVGMFAMLAAMRLEKLVGFRPAVLFTGGGEKGGDGKSGGYELGLHAWQVNLSDCRPHTSGQSRACKAETAKRGKALRRSSRAIGKCRINHRDAEAQRLIV